jgi:hypothetical protein
MTTDPTKASRREQVFLECKQELGMNFCCSSEKIAQILAAHGAKLGLTDDEMFHAMAEYERALQKGAVTPASV